MACWNKGRRLLDVHLSDLTPEEFEEALDSRFFSFFSLTTIVSGTASAAFQLVIWSEHSSSRFLFISSGAFFVAQGVPFLLWLHGTVSRRTSGVCFGTLNALLTSLSAYLSGDPFLMVWQGTVVCFWSVFLSGAVDVWAGWVFLGALSVAPFCLPTIQVPWVSVTDIVSQNAMLPFVQSFFVLLVLSQLVRDNRLRKSKIRDSFQQLATQKDAFIATISHEIRTPLHGISATVEMLSADRGLSPASREHVQAISHCTSALGLLIENVLGLGGDSAKDSPVVEVATERLLARVRDYAQALAMARPELRLRVEARPGALPRVLEMQQSAVLQILLNLVSNAIKFSTPASREVAVRFDMERLPPRHDVLVAEVVDEGAGVREEFRPRLFLPYSRDVSTASGTGLGLMICKKLAEKMGGQMHYRPREDSVGSVFSLRLPVRVVVEGEGDGRGREGGSSRRQQPERSAKKRRPARVEAAAVEAAPVPAEPIAVATTAPAPIAMADAEETDVIVVEDNIVNQRVIVKMLGTLGVVPAGVYADGASALQHLLQNSKQVAEGARSGARRTVLLLDNTMPVLTGVQVAELWRRFEAAAGAARPAKICLVTASHTAPTPHLDHVILKPLTLEGLRNALK